MHFARAKTAYGKCIQFWPDSARDARIMANKAACISRVWLGRTSVLAVRHRGAFAGRPPPERGPLAARFRRWLVNAPPTAFHGRCGRPAMFDTKAVQGAFMGLAAASGMVFAFHARAGGGIDPSRRPINALLAVFRGQYGRPAMSAAQTSRGAFTGLAAAYAALSDTDGGNRGVVVVMTCENGPRAGFRRFRSNRLFVGKFTAKRQIFRKIYSRDL